MKSPDVHAWNKERDEKKRKTKQKTKQLEKMFQLTTSVEILYWKDYINSKEQDTAEQLHVGRVPPKENSISPLFELKP